MTIDLIDDFNKVSITSTMATNVGSQPHLLS